MWSNWKVQLKLRLDVGEEKVPILNTTIRYWVCLARNCLQVNNIMSQPIFHSNVQLSFRNK